MNERKGKRWHPFLNVIGNTYKGMKQWDDYDTSFQIRLRLFHVPIINVVVEISPKNRIMFGLQLFCFFLRVGAYNWRIMEKGGGARP